jgi:hypothetical protein
VICLTLGFLLPAGGQIPAALPHAVADEPQRPRGQQAVHGIHRAVRPGRRGDEAAGQDGLGTDQCGHRDRAAAGHRHRVDRHAERDVHVELGAAERGQRGHRGGHHDQHRDRPAAPYRDREGHRRAQHPEPGLRQLEPEAVPQAQVEHHPEGDQDGGHGIERLPLRRGQPVGERRPRPGGRVCGISRQ